MSWSSRHRLEHSPRSRLAGLARKIFDALSIFWYSERSETPASNIENVQLASRLVSELR